MLHSLYHSGSLPEVFVFVFPKIDIVSMGSSMLESPPPIPIKTPSVAGEFIVFAFVFRISIYKCIYNEFWKKVFLHSLLAFFIEYNGKV